MSRKMVRHLADVDGGQGGHNRASTAPAAIPPPPPPPPAGLSTVSATTFSKVALLISVWYTACAISDTIGAEMVPLSSPLYVTFCFALFGAVAGYALSMALLPNATMSPLAMTLLFRDRSKSGLFSLLLVVSASNAAALLLMFEGFRSGGMSSAYALKATEPLLTCMLATPPIFASLSVVAAAVCRVVLRLHRVAAWWSRRGGGAGEGGYDHQFRPAKKSAEEEEEKEERENVTAPREVESVHTTITPLLAPQVRQHQQQHQQHYCSLPAAASVAPVGEDLDAEVRSSSSDIEWRNVAPSFRMWVAIVVLVAGAFAVSTSLAKNVPSSSSSTSSHSRPTQQQHSTSGSASRSLANNNNNNNNNNNRRSGGGRHLLHSTGSDQGSATSVGALARHSQQLATAGHSSSSAALGSGGGDAGGSSPVMMIGFILVSNLLFSFRTTVQKVLLSQFASANLTEVVAFLFINIGLMSAVMLFPFVVVSLVLHGPPNFSLGVDWPYIFLGATMYYVYQMCNNVVLHHITAVTYAIAKQIRVLCIFVFSVFYFSKTANVLQMVVGIVLVLLGTYLYATEQTRLDARAKARAAAADGCGTQAVGRVPV